MDTRYFTEEHEIFRRTVRSFVERELLPHVDQWEEEEDYPREIFPRMGELGFLGIRYPEEYGGSGLDFFATVVFAEELGRCRSGGLSGSVLVHTDMATPPVALLGTDEQKRRFLIPAIKGEKIAALGITEPNAGSDVASMQTFAQKNGSHYVLNGTKTFITNGCKADFVTLAARTDKGKGHQGISLFIMEKGMPGFTVSKRLKKMGFWTSDTAELVFEDCMVPEENLLGEEGKGFSEIMQNFQGERLIVGVGAVARAQQVFEDALQYAKERVQFGRPIGKFQVNKHKLVDMATQIEAARQLVYNTAWLFSQGLPCVKEVSMCKVFACEVAQRVAHEALQIHGGYGYMMEYPVQRAFRDFRLSTIAGGTSEIMKEIIGKELGL